MYGRVDGRGGFFSEGSRRAFGAERNQGRCGICCAHTLKESIAKIEQKGGGKGREWQWTGLIVSTGCKFGVVGGEFIRKAERGGGRWGGGFATGFGEYSQAEEGKSLPGMPLDPKDPET